MIDDDAARAGEKRPAGQDRDVPSNLPPLIVTLELDDASRAWFDELRRRHFPRHRNVLDAHVTLFHALPGEREAEVAEALATAAHRAPVPVEVTGVRLLGRGVAYDLAAPPVVRLREHVADRFRPDLTRQDAQRPHLHVTVANKLEPERARELFGQLRNVFVPFSGRGTGLSLFRYVGGPWEPVSSFAFADPAEPTSPTVIRS